MQPQGRGHDGSGLFEGLDTPLRLNDENASSTHRVSNVLGANRSVEDVPHMEGDRIFLSVDSKMHFHLPIQHDENLLTVVDVPLVGLVGPVQASCYAIHVGNRQGTPSTLGGEIAGSNDLHGKSLWRQTFLLCGGIHLGGPIERVTVTGHLQGFLHPSPSTLSTLTWGGNEVRQQDSKSDELAVTCQVGPPLAPPLLLSDLCFVGLSNPPVVFLI